MKLLITDFEDELQEPAESPTHPGTQGGAMLIG